MKTKINPIAKLLRLPLFRNRLVRNKKKYTRNLIEKERRKRMNKDEERLRRAKRTGKYFDTSTSKPKNLWLNHIFPILLLISFFFYIYYETS